MDERKIYKEALSRFSPDMTEEQQNNYLDFMEKKKSTVLHGDDVVHLEYFHGLLDDEDIKHITGELQEVAIKLSRYDKNGIAFANLQDFALQVSLGLKDPIVQSIVGGLAVNGIWAVLKKTIVYLWNKIKSKQQSENGKSKMNFGLRVQVAKNKLVDFKLDGDFSEETVLKALDKVIPTVQHDPGFEEGKLNFLIFDPQSEEWHLIDTMAKFRRIAAEQQLKRNAK